MSRRVRHLLAAAMLVVGPLTLTACLDELEELFTILVFTESDDPQVRETGEAMKEVRRAREAMNQTDHYLATRDPQYLENAIELQPNSSYTRALKLAEATLAGDPDEIAAAQEALSLAEARRLAATRAPGVPIPRSELRKNVLKELLWAQSELLLTVDGGSMVWDPPGPDAPEEQRRLWSNYCATDATLRRDHGVNLSRAYGLPCP